MPLIKTVLVRVSANTGDTRAKLDAIAAKAEELKHLSPELTVKIDAATAAAKMAVLRRELRATSTEAAGPGGLFTVLSQAVGQASGFFGKLAAGIGSLASAGPQGIAVLAGITAGVAALAAVTGPLIVSLGLVTAGIGIFAAAAFPVFSQLKQSLTTLSTATDAYQQASKNLDQAIHKSPADMQAYHQALSGLEPDLRRAAVLLTDQNAQWQKLTPAQQKSVDALANNSAALKTLLPDQRNALNALMAQKAAWDALSPAQQKIAGQMHQLGGEFGKLQKAVQPAVYQALNTAIKILSQLLPALTPLAVAAGKALDGFLKRIEGWLNSPSGKGFIEWLKVKGPEAMATFGRALWDVTHAVGIFVDHWVRAGEWIIKIGRWVVHQIASNLDTVRINLVGSAQNVAKWASDVGHWVTVAWNWFQQLPGKIMGFLSNLPSMLFQAGVHAIASLIGGLQSMIPSLGSVVSSIASKVAGFFGLSPAKEGPLSGAGSMYNRGLHIGADLAAGIAASTAHAGRAATGLAGAAVPGTGRGGITIELHVPPGGDMLGPAFWTEFGRGIRVRGGDPAILQRKVVFR